MLNHARTLCRCLPAACLSALAAGAALAPAAATAAELLLNEYNAVGSSAYLNGGDATTDGDGNSTNPPADPFFGRVAGNGGDWFELTVVADHLDIRGWSLHICDNGVCDTQLDFASHAVWSDLRTGTLLTISEDVPTDLSFDPGSGDWWMNVQASNGGPGTYITPTNFPVSNANWQLEIRDELGNTIFGPFGEHMPVDPVAGCFPPQDDVNSGEIFRLEQAPSALVDPCHKTLNDWEDGVLSTFGQPNEWNGRSAVQSLAHLRANAPFPDRDGDQVPDDGDLSGIAGDSPCTAGATVGCDDNCPALQNAGQLDTGGPGGPDGMGDACQCGDPSGDDDVNAADVLELRELFAGLRTALSAPERCSVHSSAACTLVDLVVLSRAVHNPALAPGLAPACQLAAVATDQSEHMFHPDRLLTVDIKLDLADWDLLRFEENDIFDTFFSPDCGTGPWNDPYNWYHAEATVDGETFADVGLRKKGFQGSLSTTMPSFKLKFDHWVGGQQLNSMDRLTLNNNLQDPAHVKQCLGYELMRRAGVPAPRCNFSHLTVTTVDGAIETVVVDRIYTHLESIKDPFLRRNFGSDSDQGRLYEGALSDFWAGSFRNTIEPKTLSAAANTSEIDALTATLMDAGLTDAQRLAAIAGLVDVDDFLTFWASEGMIGHWDGYADDQNNFWFYVDPADGLIRFIPWGADDTFGRGNPLRAPGDPVHADAIVPRAALTRALYAILGQQSLYLARLQLLMDTVYDETGLHAEIARMRARIEPVAGDLSDEIAPITTWVDAHRASVNDEIASPPAGFTTQPNHFCVLNP